MKVVIDIEANALVNPTQIWLVVCKNIDTGEQYIFRNLTSNEEERKRFQSFSVDVDLWIGHNFLGYDLGVINSLLGPGVCINADHCLDTLILSKLIDYPRKGHSIEAYGEEFGIAKGEFHKWNDPQLLQPSSDLYQELQSYCIRDVDICHKVYLKYLKYINKEEHKASIELEHKFQLIVNQLTTNGFSFNIPKAQKLLDTVTKELKILDEAILKEFPPKERLIREFTPKETKHGTISRTSVPRALHGRIHEYLVGHTYRHTDLVAFNPASHKQVVEVLWEAGWKPEERTQTYIDTDRELKRLKHSRQPANQIDLDKLSAKLLILEKTGWKINEFNLGTLPPSAPAPARTLAKRILYESRRRTLTEWLGLVNPDTSRIHGKFYGIGAWTHRMAHQQPNTANIPNEFGRDGKKKLLGKELRSLWQAPRNRLLVGVDAEGIQFRIAAHYINDPILTKGIVEGKKSEGTDPHSFNKKLLGDICKTRNAAKTFLFALILGGSAPKFAEGLGCTVEEAEEAVDTMYRQYPGLVTLKKEIVVADAKRGWFEGIDGRRVKIPGDTFSNRKHLCSSGYLQNGEAVVMKAATVKFHPRLKELKSLLVDLVHDEWQTETPNNMDIALEIAKLQADSLREVGEELGLKCPLAGSYWNDDLKDHTIATNWAFTH